MKYEQMQDFLNKIQQEKTETKIMSSILTCFQQIKILEKAVIELQQKVNEIINKINAATVNQEDGIIDADITAAEEVKE